MAGFSEPLISGRLGKLGSLTSLYYDHYFVLDEHTLQYESSSGSRRMKTYYLEELQDCIRLPNKRDNEFTFVFSGERSGPIWKIHVLTAAELMKRHLQRKASVKVVEHKEQILTELVHILAADWQTADEARAAYDEIGRRMDALGVPVEGTEWPSRLLIAKKGGGHHFDAEQLALAARAHERASALCDFTARSRQLQQRAAHMRTLHAALEANAELARERRIERLHSALHAALRVYREVIMAASAQADNRRFEQARIPGSLQVDGDDLLAALPAASHGAYLVAQDELASLRRENASARRFRASRAQIIVQQVIAVHTDVGLQLEHLGRAAPPEVGAERLELETVCAELQSEANALGPAGSEEEADAGI